jgi:GTP-binding protein EngB required for normal cell division
MKSKSVQEWYYCRNKQKKAELKEFGNTTYPNELNIINVVRKADKILKEERMRVAKEITELLGYELKHRTELTDYEYKKKENPRIKVNGKSYLLTKIDSKIK